MNVEPSVMSIFTNSKLCLNEKHLAQYLLMLRISKNGTKEFAISGKLLGKRLGETRTAVRKRRIRMVKLGLIQIRRYDKNKPIYWVPIPPSTECAGGLCNEK